MMKKLLLWMIAFVLLASAVSAITDADITPHLIAYWDFEEGSGSTITDSTGHGFTGTVYNGATWTTSSKLGTYSMVFDDTLNSLVNLTGDDPLWDVDETNEGISIFGWFYQTTPDAPAQTHRLVAKTSGTGAGWDVHMTGNTPSRYVLADDGNLVLTGDSSASVLNEWTFLMFCAKDGNQTIVKNTSAKYGGDTAAVELNNDRGIFLGSGMGFSPQYPLNAYAGRMDGVGIANTTFCNDTAYIDYLWNSGAGRSFFNTKTPTFISPTPADGEINNTIRIINISCENANLYNLWFDTNLDPVTQRLTQSSERNWTMPGLVDNTYYYKASCYNASTGIPTSSNTVVRNYTYDTIAPTVIATLTGNLTVSNRANITFHINYTESPSTINRFNVSNDSTLINTTISQADTFYIYNGSLNISSNAVGEHNITTWVCDNPSNCHLETFLYYKISDTVDYESTVVQDDHTTHRLILNISGSPFIQANIVGVLIYNNTKISPILSTSGDIVTLTATAIVPNITPSLLDMEFRWDFNISDNLLNTTSYNQTVGDFILTECGGTYNVRTLNISILNESAPTQSILASSLSQTYDVYDSTGAFYRSYNFTNTTALSNFSLCIFPNATITTDFIMDYVYDTIHFTYHGYQINLSNLTKTLSLYATDGTSQIVYNVKDSYDNDVEDVYITVEKYDVGTNSYKTVELLRTDYEGNAIGRAVLYTAWYRFTLKYEGETKLVDGPTKLTSTTKNFQINLLGLDWFDHYDSFRDITYNLYYNNASKNFGLTWDDPTLKLQKICLRVENVTNKGKTVVDGDSCSHAHSGTLLVNVGGSVDDQMFIATAWAFVSGSPKDTFYLGTLQKDFLYEFLFYDRGEGGRMGIFVTFLLVLTLTFIGIWHPVASIVLMLLGFGVMRIFGMYYMAWPMFVALMVIGGIAIYKMTRST